MESLFSPKKEFTINLLTTLEYNRYTHTFIYNVLRVKSKCAHNLEINLINNSGNIALLVLSN